MIEKLKIYFEIEKTAIYKIGVRIFVPNPVTGFEEAFYVRTFDENTFYQLCDNAFRPDVISYYNSSEL